jgi:5,10-methylenetetrahydromethanopterin reductase
MTLNALFDYVQALRQLLAGVTAVVEGKPARMLNAPG